MVRFDPNKGLFLDENGKAVGFMDRLAHERWPLLGAQMAEGPELLAALKRCHGALDTLFAMLVKSFPEFRPSQSGEPWDATVKANELIKKLEGK